MSDRRSLLGSLVFKLVISPAGLLTRELSGGHLHMNNSSLPLLLSKPTTSTFIPPLRRILRRTLRLPGSSWDSLAFQWNKNKHNRIRKWMLWGRSWLALNEGSPGHREVSWGKSGEQRCHCKCLVCSHTRVRQGREATENEEWVCYESQGTNSIIRIWSQWGKAQVIKYWR